MHVHLLYKFQAGQLICCATKLIFCPICMTLRTSPAQIFPACAASRSPAINSAQARLVSTEANVQQKNKKQKHSLTVTQHHRLWPCFTVVLMLSWWQWSSVPTIQLRFSDDGLKELVHLEFLALFFFFAKTSFKTIELCCCSAQIAYVKYLLSNNLPWPL